MIRTQNLYLQELVSTEKYSYYEIASADDDFALIEYVSFFKVTSINQAGKFITERYLSNVYKLIGIYRAKDDKLVGSILLDGNFYPMLLVSYFIGKKYRMNGYMYEALKGLIDNFKSTKEIKSLSFYVRSDNEPSIKLLDKWASISQKRSQSFNPIEIEYVKYNILF